MGGIKHMERLPDALFVIDVGHERIAITEANKLGIPVVAVVDTNCSPDGIDYVIPGNDDAIRAIQLYVDAIAKAVQDGRRSSGKLDEEEAAAADGAAAASSARELRRRGDERGTRRRGAVHRGRCAGGRRHGLPPPRCAGRATPAAAGAATTDAAPQPLA